MQSELFYSYIMMRTSFILMRWWWSPFCIRPTRFI